MMQPLLFVTTTTTTAATTTTTTTFRAVLVRQCAVTRPQLWMLRPIYYTPSICRAPLCYTLPALHPCCDSATKVDAKAHLQYPSPISS